MCGRPISPIVPVFVVDVEPVIDEESDYGDYDSESDEFSYVSDSSEHDDWWEEPEPTCSNEVLNQITFTEQECEAVDDFKYTATRQTSIGERQMSMDDGYVNEHSIDTLGNATKTEDTAMQRTAINWATEMNTTAPHKITNSFAGIYMVLRKHIMYGLRRDLKPLEKCVPELDKFYDCNRALEKFSTPTQTLINFALFLDLDFPSAYDFLIDNYNTPLPSRKGLSEWYLDELGRPGLARKSFEILKEMSSHKRLTCTLKWYLVLVANSKVDHKHDKVFVRDTFRRTDDQAVQTLVFELTSIDEGWRMPVGFFYGDWVREETHASFIRACLTQCYAAGVDVVAVTFNTASPAEHLGCRFEDVRNLKTTFKHPACDRDVAAWIDPHASFKSVYHTLKSKLVLCTATDEWVRWSSIQKLKKMMTSHYADFYGEDFLAGDFDTILEMHHHLAKVGLTSAVMSGSLASALAVGQTVIPDWFKNSAPTQYFIESFNWLYDILNSGSSPAITSDKSFDIFRNLDETKTYIAEILCKTENCIEREDSNNLDDELNIPCLLEGRVISGFIGFLITIESFKYLFDTLVTKEKRMSNLFTSRLCRDQHKYVVLESWESMADHFESRYRELGRNNSLGHELSSVLKYSLQKGSVHPFDMIKATSDRRAFDYDQPADWRPHKLSLTARELRATQTMEQYVCSLQQEIPVVERKYMAGYLAGWIAATYAKSLKCEECVDMLLSDQKLWFHKYIHREEMVWICLPSEGLFRVCWECERAIKGKRTAQRVREDVFTNLSVRSPWSARPERHHWTHATLLMHLIVDKYLAIRVSTSLPRREFRNLEQMNNTLEHFALSNSLHCQKSETDNC